MSEFSWTGDAFALRVATTLLHFVWQGLILAFVVGMAGVLLQRASARCRYSVNVVTLLAMVTCLPVTFAMLGDSSGDTIQLSVTTAADPAETRTAHEFLTAYDSTGIEHRRVEGTPNESSDDRKDASLRESAIAAEQSSGAPLVPDSPASPSSTQQLSEFFGMFSALASFLTWSYFLGVLFMTVRLTVGLRGGQSLRRDSTLVEDASLLTMVHEQAVRVGLRCAPAIAYCEQISIPIVIGIVRPMILLPATLVSGLSPDQLQALVTHELSHIRRYDLIVNLLQRMIEAVLFFHPAVWFVSRRISMERENVADDAVVAAGWPAVRYADALVRMAELSSTARTSNVAIQVAALAASGNSSSEFRRRVVRLLNGSSSAQLRLSRSGVFAMVICTASLLVAPVAVQLSAEDVRVKAAASAAREDSSEPEQISANTAEEAPANVDEAESPKTPSDDPRVAAPPRVVDGFVTGPSGAIPDVTVKATLYIADEETHNSFIGLYGKIVKKMQYTTDKAGRYKIEIPAELAANPLARVTVQLSHPDYLGRRIGPLAISDFDGERIGNDQPFWMGRKIARQAIKRSYLRKARQLQGRILLPDGTPAAGAKVKTATKYRAYSWKFHRLGDYGTSDEAITDQDGQFSIVIDDSASFTAMMPGQAPLIIDDLTKRLKLANRDLENDFRLPAAIRIKGRVLTDDGKHVPRAIVTARRDVKWNEHDMPLSYSTSCAADEFGYYELPPLPADGYGLSINGQLSDQRSAEIYNKFISSFRIGEPPAFKTQPLDLVFVPQRVTLEPFTPSTTVNLQAAQMVTLKVNVEFPDGAPSTDRQHNVGISGTFNGKEWNGQYAAADENGVATLRAPKGLELAFIKTGLARHKRSADSDVEIGQAVHFKRLDEDISGVTVIKPAMARLEVDLTQSYDATSTEGRPPGRVSISASYVRKGFRERSSDRQKFGLTGAMLSGQTNYQATALPNEPIVLTVSVFNNGARTTLHEEQLTLAPGEKRVRKFRLVGGKLDAEKEKVESAQSRAIEFLLKQQRADGSWARTIDGPGYVTGTTALVAMTLYKGGEQSDEAV
ncbi:MAG: beta-lactamase regulating signal transducer with metallopeptidase domain, partial [Planctomycetaceae bacterium]